MPIDRSIFSTIAFVTADCLHKSIQPSFIESQSMHFQLFPSKQCQFKFYTLKHFISLQITIYSENKIKSATLITLSHCSRIFTSIIQNINIHNAVPIRIDGCFPLCFASVKMIDTMHFIRCTSFCAQARKRLTRKISWNLLKLVMYIIEICIHILSRDQLSFISLKF